MEQLIARRPISFGLVLLLTMLLAVWSNGGVALGAEFTVDSTADVVDANIGDGVCDDGAGNCTLRGAIQEANALGGADTITVPPGTYFIALGDLDIAGDLTINGSGAIDTIIDGGALDRVLRIHFGTVVITGVTVQNGNTSGEGGGIINFGALTLTDSTVTGNSTIESGGGIWNGDSVTLTLTNSNVSGNTAKLGGGIVNFRGTVNVENSTVSANTGGSDGGGGILNNGGPMTLTNSTVSGNSSDSIGGGIYNTGDSTLTVINSNVSGNTADGSGGGVYNGSGTTELVNTIIAMNSAAGTGPDCSGSHTSLGYNLIGDTTDCQFIATTGDLVGDGANPIDPLLGPLQDNGGPTFTHALITSSPAIDAIPVADCNDTLGEAVTTDQRGVLRPQGSACDIGSYELESVIEEDTRFTVQINGGHVVPPVDTIARGRGRFELDASETGICGTLQIGDILGVTAAHIHCGLPGKNGPVGITLKEFAQPVDFVDPTKNSWSIFAPNEGNGCGWANIDSLVKTPRPPGAMGG